MGSVWSIVSGLGSLRFAAEDREMPHGKLSPHTTIIAPEKLRDYVLNPTNPDGEPKARFLGEMGYDQRNWRILEVDLRTQHLSQDVQPGKSSMYGKKYEIIAPLVGPNGNTR